MVNGPLRTGRDASRRRRCRAKEMPDEWTFSSFPESCMAPSKSLQAKQTVPDQAGDAVRSALRTLDAEGGGIAALAAALQGPLGLSVRRRRRSYSALQGPRHRHGPGQIRPRRAQDCRHLCLHRHPGLLRACRRSRSRRSRHDHAGRRHHRAVVVRRAAGDEEPRQLFEPLRHSDDRGDGECGVFAGRGRRNRAGIAERARGLSAQSRADDVVADAGRDRRRAGDRAAGGPRLHGAGVRQLSSRRQAWRDAEIRPRHHAHRRRHAGKTAGREDVGRAGGDVIERFRLRLHRRSQRRDRRHYHRRRSAPSHAAGPDDRPGR